MNELALFCSAFVAVFALGFQSQNVTHGHYWLAFLTSFAIGGGQLVLMRFVPDASWTEIAATLMGGPLGITASMYVHKHLVRLKKPWRCVLGLHDWRPYSHLSFHSHHGARGRRCARCFVFRVRTDLPPRPMPSAPPSNINCGADRP